MVCSLSVAPKKSSLLKSLTPAQSLRLLTIETTCNAKKIFVARPTQGIFLEMIGPILFAIARGNFFHAEIINLYLGFWGFTQGISSP